MTEAHLPYADFREALRANAWSPEEIRREKASHPELATTPRWRRDPVIGHVERTYAAPTRGARPVRAPGIETGVDGSGVRVTITPEGWRRRIWDDGRTPRINTYGDSYTNGTQVNDGETWQEYLAAHFLEPIGNFGTGSGSVHQTYLRMVREESTGHGGEYLLFYIWGDDHLRSVLGFGLPTVGVPSRLAIGNPYLAWDPAAGGFSEHDAWLTSADDLDRLGDPEWLEARFGDNLAHQLCAFGGHPAWPPAGPSIRSVDDAPVSAAAASFGLPWTGERTEARGILDRIGLEASIHTVEKARRFADQHGKKIMFLLFDPFRSVKSLVEDGTRYDQRIVDHLIDAGAEFFDMTSIHAEEIRTTGITYEDFTRAYFATPDGHYSPVGNHRFAFALKPRLVDWLDPKPITYRDDAPIETH